MRSSPMSIWTMPAEPAGGEPAARPAGVRTRTRSQTSARSVAADRQRNRGLWQCRQNHGHPRRDAARTHGESRPRDGCGSRYRGWYPAQHPQCSRTRLPPSMRIRAGIRMSLLRRGPGPQSSRDREYSNLRWPLPDSTSRRASKRSGRCRHSTPGPSAFRSSVNEVMHPSSSRKRSASSRSTTASFSPASSRGSTTRRIVGELADLYLEDGPDLDLREREDHRQFLRSILTSIVVGYETYFRRSGELS